MRTVVVGLGPAGRGVLSSLHLDGALASLCRDGLSVVDPDLRPGAGAIGRYDVRSDSAAIVFAHCVQAIRHEPEVVGSAALARILALPDGESIALRHVGEMLTDATATVLRLLRRSGADVRLGSRVTHVEPGAAGHRLTLADADGAESLVEADRVILTVGGRPWVPDAVRTAAPGAVHSESVLRRGGTDLVLTRLPADPRVVVVGRAHSAFSVADQLLSHPGSTDWSPGAVTMATRGAVRVTYPDAWAARTDGAVFSADDVCPESGRVWRLCGLRGDAAARYRAGRDGLDPRLSVAEVGEDADALARLLASADLVVSATGYRSRLETLFDEPVTVTPDGRVESGGRPLPGIVAVGLGSGGRRHPERGGEPSYDGPVDGVWHYQHVQAPAVLRDLGLLPSGRPALTA